MRALLFATSLVLAALPARGVEGQELQVRVWMDRGHEPVLSRGERARLYYHVSDDAYVAVFHIDTNGLVRLLHPGSPEEADWVRGGRDYRLLFPHSSYWYVEDDPGMGYFFAVASPEPLDFSMLRYSRWEGGWDLARVGRQVYRDPYAAMDDYVAYLIPDWEYVPYALDFTSYHVGDSWEYPRFLCYDCHGFRPYSAWNPYLSACVNFRVVVYDDPYYYPVSRYRGTQVVYVRPPVVGQPRFVFKERASGEPAVPLVRRRDAADAPPVERRAVPGTGGDPLGPVRRGTPTQQSVPSRPGEGVERRGVAPEERRPSEAVRAPGGREFPTLERRPSERAAPPAVRPDPAPREREVPAGRSAPPATGRSGAPATGEGRTERAPAPVERRAPSRTSPLEVRRPSSRSGPEVREAPPSRAATPSARGAAPRRDPPPPARSSPSSRGSSPPARSAPSTRPAESSRPRNPPARSPAPAARSSAPSRSPGPAARSPAPSPTPDPAARGSAPRRSPGPAARSSGRPGFATGARSG